MFRTIDIFNVMCFCELITLADLSETSMKWKVKTNSVIYGNDTILTCNGNYCSPLTSKQWIGGPRYDLLCSENYTTNPFKYEMMIQPTNAFFDLMIKNFTFNDANCEYTCVCGLQQYTEMLKLDSLEFIYPPVIDTVSFEAKERKAQIDVWVKVYPLPTCMISYHGIDFPVNILNYTTTNIQTERFDLYTAWISHILDVPYLCCSGNITLTCKVGSQNFTLFLRSMNNYEQQYSIHTVVAIFGTIVVFLLLLVIIVLSQIKKKICLKSAHMDGNLQQDNTHMVMIETNVQQNFKQTEMQPLRDTNTSFAILDHDHDNEG